MSPECDCSIYTEGFTVFLRLAQLVVVVAYQVRIIAGVMRVESSCARGRCYSVHADIVARMDVTETKTKKQEKTIGPLVGRP